MESLLKQTCQSSAQDIIMYKHKGEHNLEFT